MADRSSTAAVAPAELVEYRKPSLARELFRHRYLLLLMLPGIAYFVVFRYVPIYGVILAFKEYDVYEGILFSPWVGLKHFRRLFEQHDVARVFWNTVEISVLRIVFGFPMPIILALLLNEIFNTKFKRTVQTISYLPHFLSWVVVAGLITELLSPSRGIYGYLMRLIGADTTVLLTSQTWFIPILIISGIWKEVGWGTIIYLATMSSINPELYEAAVVDGASRWRRAISITLPGILPVTAILLILSMSQILNAGFDQIFNLYNTLVYEIADIIDTYIYRVGLQSFEFEFATAVGLTKNVIALVLVLTVDRVVRRFTGYGLW
ncbi:MAG: ABC transporter permease subunit [Spirochaetaceae bacterium]|nr:ABC transporter permease subunit [Spirochaetaceae bacterium]